MRHPGIPGSSKALPALLALLLSGCGATPNDASPNILLLLVDDVSTDLIGAYSEGVGVAATPSIDALAREGVLFRNAWATPMCSPTRASMLTGTLPSTHGIGHAISNKRLDRAPGLDLGRGLATLPSVLRERGYASFVAGKWHLGPGDRIEPRHVLEAGFDHHAGRSRTSAESRTTRTT